MVTFILVVLLMALTLLLTVAVAAAVRSLHRSDPAGNGLAIAYTAVGMGALWFAVGLMTLVACLRRNAELVAAVGAGALSTADLMVFAAFVVAVPSQVAFLRLLDARRSRGVFAHVLQACVVLSPLVFVVHDAWRTFGWVRNELPTPVAAWGMLGALMAVCLIPWPGAVALARRAANGKRASRAARDLIDEEVARRPRLGDGRDPTL